MNDLVEPFIDELLEVDANSITTMIDEGVEIHGKVCVANGRAILISGKVVGSVESNGVVIVNVGGNVEGSIKAKSLQVGGQIERISENDLIHVSGIMILAATAVVNCDAQTGGVKTAYGAIMDGRFRPHPQPQPPSDEGGKTISPVKPRTILT